MEIQKFLRRQSTRLWDAASRQKEWRVIACIVTIGACIRLIGIGYGLPFHVFSDEEALINGALRMIEMRTLLPVFHWEVFQDLLYYPPFLSYIFALLFLPLALVKFFAMGMPSMSVFKEALVIDPSLFWYGARTMTALLGAGNGILIYAIARRVFRGADAAFAAVFASALFAMSFIDATLSATARHWVPTLFFSLLSVWLAVHAVSRENRRWALASGIALGISFGMGYLVFFFPIVALIFFMERGRGKPWKDLLFFFFAGFFSVALLVILLHPQPFLEQVIDHTYPRPGEVKSVPKFLAYYGWVLWRYETPLVIAGVFGWIVSFFRQRWLWIFLTSLLVMIGGIVYIFLWNIPRYMSPVIPFLALFGGYGLGWLHVAAKKYMPWAAWMLCAILAGYGVLVYGRYAFLMARGDTRNTAAAWIESHAPKDAPVFILADRMRLTPNASSIDIMAREAPAALRSSEKIFLGKDPEVFPSMARMVYHVYHVSGERDRARVLIAGEEAASSSLSYIVVNEWEPPPDHAFASRIAGQTPIVVFSGELSIRGSHRTYLFIGGDEGTLALPVLQALFRIRQFGPPMAVYAVSNESR